MKLIEHERQRQWTLLYWSFTVRLDLLSLSSLRRCRVLLERSSRSLLRFFDSCSSRVLERCCWSVGTFDGEEERCRLGTVEWQSETKRLSRTWNDLLMSDVGRQSFVVSIEKQSEVDEENDVLVVVDADREENFFQRKSHRTVVQTEFSYRRRSFAGGVGERLRCRDRLRLRVRLRRSTDFLRSAVRR